MDHTDAEETWLAALTRLVRRFSAEVRAAARMGLEAAPLALVQWAWSQGYPYVRPLPDGRLVGIRSGPGRVAEVWIGTRTATHRTWPYATLGAALHAAQTWDGLDVPAGHQTLEET